MKLKSICLDSANSHRELLVSIRFNEPGWQWSGCFLPDHLSDTQVKMQNHVSGAVNEACCIDVEILSRCLEAKLTVCCYSLSRDKEAVVGKMTGPALAVEMSNFHLGRLAICATVLNRGQQITTQQLNAFTVFFVRLKVLF
ncbi:hypothetical protein CsSME_00039998 [Camellia sinensis var. sinensis]